jgi:parvulin-like peptidyl-prolyl isomerase
MPGKVVPSEFMKVACRCTAVGAVCLAVTAVSAQEGVIARVGSRAVTVEMRDNRLRILPEFDALGLSDEQRARLVDGVTNQLVDEAIVLEYLRTNLPQVLASDDEIRLEVEQIENEAARLGQSLDQWLADQPMGLGALRYEIAWQLSWSKYLEEMATDAALEQHFNAQRPRYDGTRWQVAHLLLKVDDEAPDEAWQAAAQRAADIHTELVEGRLAWETAVQDFSQAPSKNRGGDLGWIEYPGVMPLEFAETVSELTTGQVSPPVRTPFGIHLIKCLSVEPGRRRWQDVAEQLRQDVTRRLFRECVERHRPAVTIEFVEGGDRLESDK